MPALSPTRLGPVALALLLVSAAAIAYSNEERVFHSSLPLGTDAVVLQPHGATVYILASAQSNGFQGLRRITQDERRLLLDGDGRPVAHYPARLDFRVTASARVRHHLGFEPFPLHTERDLNSFLLGLTFRLKIFRGLDSRALAPEAAALIGVPADVPYDERTYRVTFDLRQVSLDERIMLEVLAPDGSRVSKFGLAFP